MHFEIKLTTFLNQKDRFEEFERNSLFLMSTKSNYLINYFISNLKKSLKESIKIASYDEINPDWIRDKLLSLDFFDNNNVYIIYEAEKIPTSTLELLNEHQKFGENKLFLLSKSDKLIKKIPSTQIYYNFNQINFTDCRDFINSFFKEKNILINEKQVALILELSGVQFDEIYKFIDRLTNATNQGQLEHEVILDLFEDVNPFQIVDAFNARDLVKFLKLFKILMRKRDQLFQVVNLLKSHTSKVMYQKFNGQTKLYKYEKGIFQAQKNWDKRELSQFVLCLSEFEIMIKKNTAHSFNFLSSTILKNYQNQCKEFQNY